MQAGAAWRAGEVVGALGPAQTGAAEILAWASITALAGGIEGVGALGPAQAFGIEGLQAGVADAGISRI